MTHPLTEKIFNAVYTWLETIHKSGMTYDQSNSLLRTAIQSVLDGEGIDTNEIENLKAECLHLERSDLYWITQFQKVTDYWYGKELPNMDKSEFLQSKVRKAPKRPIPAQPTVENELDEILKNGIFSSFDCDLFDNILAWHQKHSGRVEVSDDLVRNIIMELDIYATTDKHEAGLPTGDQTRLNEMMQLVKKQIDNFMTRKEAK